MIFFDEFRPHVQAKGKFISNELKQSHKSYFQLLIQHLQLKKPETSSLNGSTDPQFEHKAIAEIKAYLHDSALHIAQKQKLYKQYLKGFWLDMNTKAASRR